jgi:flagellar basal-body rod protein FlgC
MFKADGSGGVEISDLIEDKGAFQTILDPGHPNADADGFVMMPNVNMASEMINLNIASRTYQANAAIMKRYQKMVETSLGLLK